METGLSIFNGIEIPDQIKYFKKYGINRTFTVSEMPDFDGVMKIFNDNDIICETLHAPFDRINDMWSEDEAAGTAMLSRLKDSVDKCEKYNIPVTVVHVSSGRPMPEITEQGIKRYEEIFKYANQKGVMVALENLRYLENLQYFMDRYDTPGFCWDNGHEYCYSPDVKFMKLFGERLAALHIHDNNCKIDTDEHVLPFDGKINMEEVAKHIADSGFDGTLMLEIGKLVCVNGEKVYANLSDEEYVKRAAESARRLADMVEKYKNM